MTADHDSLATRGIAAASTLETAEFLVRQGDVARFKAWLEEHSKPVQYAIVRHIETKWGRRR